MAVKKKGGGGGGLNTALVSKQSIIAALLTVSAGSTGWVGADIPALCTKTSTPLVLPVAAMASGSARIEASLATSRGRLTAKPGPECAASTALSSAALSGLRHVAIRLSPRARICFAHSIPIPRLQPVTRKTVGDAMAAGAAVGVAGPRASATLAMRARDAVADARGGALPHPAGACQCTTLPAPLRLYGLRAPRGLRRLRWRRRGRCRQKGRGRAGHRVSGCVRRAPAVHQWGASECNPTVARSNYE